MKKLLLILAAALCVCACAKQVPGQVKVTGGTVQGTVLEDMTVYKGIPFAAPPVGELRWKAPQPVVAWDGILECKDFGPNPMQGNGEGCSEDCLYLNVWTPAKSPKEKLPVMVWIYGGGFAGGATSYYDGADLARQGVILVSVAYRVGKLGFLSLPELSAEDPNGVSGNYGLLDQIAGLQWVKDNIAKFGGDPAKVTIFGESAGGISVSMLCASPLAKGLFRGAISQSGGSFGPFQHRTMPGENMQSIKYAEQDNTAWAQRAFGENYTLEQLRAADAKAVMGGFGGSGGWPIVDGYVIPDDQYKLYEAGKYNDVDVLIGYNSDEGLSFGFAAGGGSHQDQVRARYEDFADALLAAYPVEADGKVGKTARDLTRDAAFGWQTWTWARMQNCTGKGRVWLYYFDQHPDYPADSPRYGQGSPHGQDVAYVFGNPEEVQPTDKALSGWMMAYWTNFAKTGDPNGEGLPAWPLFTNDAPQTMVLTGSGCHASAVPSEAALNVLDGYFAWRRSQEESIR